MKKIILSIFMLLSLISCANEKVVKETLKNKKIELIFILDKSGSMNGLEEDTIGGFNSMIDKQKKEEGEVLVTTVLFSNGLKFLHDREPIKEVKKMTEEEYYTGGGTALLDAIGNTILKIKNQEKKLDRNKKEDRVLFVITTDGMENSSSEFTAEKIKNLIKTQTKEFGWEFLFLGANIDAVETAQKYGISASKAVQYHSDKVGTQNNYKVLNDAVKKFRGGKELDASWKEEIEKDYQERK